MPIYALCNINYFCVSAEWLFRHDLVNQLRIVLSNNDGGCSSTQCTSESHLYEDECTIV